MKRITIYIPTKIQELKNLSIHCFGWITNPWRMKRNSKLIDKLYKDLYNEINSGYWRNDISDFMKDSLTRRYDGTIYRLLVEFKSKMA